MRTRVLPQVVKRWLWFVGLWAAGVATVGVVSLILRAWIGHG